MPNLWTGLDVEPEVTARDCVICAGRRGGPFLELECGHGGPRNAPMHAHCLVDRATKNFDERGELASCPMGPHVFTAADIDAMKTFVSREAEYPFRQEPKADVESFRLKKEDAEAFRGPLDRIAEKIQALPEQGAHENWKNLDPHHANPEDVRAIIDAKLEDLERMQRDFDGYREMIARGEMPPFESHKATMGLIEVSGQVGKLQTFFRRVSDIQDATDHYQWWTEEQKVEYREKVQRIESKAHDLMQETADLDMGVAELRRNAVGRYNDNENFEENEFDTESDSSEEEKSREQEAREREAEERERVIGRTGGRRHTI